MLLKTNVPVGSNNGQYWSLLLSAPRGLYRLQTTPAQTPLRPGQTCSPRGYSRLCLVDLRGMFCVCYSLVCHRGIQRKQAKYIQIHQSTNFNVYKVSNQLQLLGN